MIPYNTVKPNVPLRKQKKKNNNKSFFSSLIPWLYLSESPVHLLLHLSLSSYYNLQMYCTWEGKIKTQVLAKVSFKYPFDAWFDL